MSFDTTLKRERWMHVGCNPAYPLLNHQHTLEPYSPPCVRTPRRPCASPSPRGTHAGPRTRRTGASPRTSRARSPVRDPVSIRIVSVKVKRRFRGRERQPTNVRRMSLRRGLLEARTTRFPTSFSSAGILSACGRTQLWSGSETFFELKKFIMMR